MSESLSNFDNQDDSNLVHDERPVLLKVLCILSWVGSGIQIISSTLYSSIVNETVKQEFFALLPNKEVVDMYEQLFILLDSTSIWYLILYLINIAVVHKIRSHGKKVFVNTLPCCSLPHRALLNCKLI